MFILSSLVILVAALVVIAVAVVLAETTLVYVALGLGGASAVLLAVECVRYLRYTAELPGGRTAERKAGMVEASRTGGLGKAPVPVPAPTGVPASHSRGTGAYPAPAGGPARDAVFPQPHVHWEVPSRQRGMGDDPTDDHQGDETPVDPSSEAATDTEAAIASLAAMGETVSEPERPDTPEPSAVDSEVAQDQTGPEPDNGPHAHAGEGIGETTSLTLDAVIPDGESATEEVPPGPIADGVDGAPAVEDAPEEPIAPATDFPTAEDSEPTHTVPVAADEPDGFTTPDPGSEPGDLEDTAAPADGVNAELPEPEDLPDIDQLPRVGNESGNDADEEALSFGAFVERLHDDDTPTDAEAGAEEEVAERDAGDEPPTGPIPTLDRDTEPVDAEPDPDATDVFTRPGQSEE